MAPIPASLLGLFGPIRDLLVDPAVRRILIDGPDRIHVQRHGMAELSTVRWNPAALEEAIAGLARRAGKPFDADSPCLEAMLRDGTRFLALRSPVVRDGPVLAISRPLPAQDEGLMAAHEAASETLALAMRAGLNVAVVGPTGTARDALMRALVGLLPTWARVVSIDDDEALDLGARPVVRLVPRRADPDGRRAVSVGDLLYSAGRLEPDRVVLNHLRIHDGWDAVALLAGRSAPVLIALAGREPADGLAWLSGFAGASGPAGRDRAVPLLVASGLDLVVTVDGGLAPRILRVDRVVPEGQGAGLEPLHLAQPNGTLTTESAHGRFAVQWTRVELPSDELPPPGGVLHRVGDLDDAEAVEPSMVGAIRDALAAMVDGGVEDEEPVSRPGARPLNRSDGPAILSSARIELPEARLPFPTVPTLTGVITRQREDDSLDIDVDVPVALSAFAHDLEVTQALDAFTPEALAAMNLRLPPDPELDEATSAERARPANPLQRLLASLDGGEEGNTSEIELALDGMEEDDEDDDGPEETVVQRGATAHRTFSEILRSLGRRAPTTSAEPPPARPPARPRRTRTTLVRDDD